MYLPTELQVGSNETVGSAVGSAVGLNVGSEVGLEVLGGALIPVGASVGTGEVVGSLEKSGRKEFFSLHSSTFTIESIMVQLTNPSNEFPSAIQSSREIETITLSDAIA